MHSKLSKVLLAVLMTVGLAALVPAASASAAPARPAMSMVDCTQNDFLWVYYHETNGDPNDNHLCFANAGTIDFTYYCKWGCWLDQFYTGNNVVQYKADDSWQPAGGVAKNVHFTFPNHPGGVDLQAMRIF